jgi:cyclophilin family peptidyl-prolyl cis-trans isomerase
MQPFIAEILSYDRSLIYASLITYVAYGAVGMARGNEDADSGSSQFFLLKWDQVYICLRICVYVYMYMHLYMYIHICIYKGQCKQSIFLTEMG